MKEQDIDRVDRSVSRFSGYYVTADDGEINKMAKEREKGRRGGEREKGNK